MNWKYIVLYHEKTGRTIDEIIKEQTSYKYEDKAISPEEALKLKMEGKKIKYPKQETGYHFFIEKTTKDYTIRPGRSLQKYGAHNKLSKVNRQGIGICIPGNFNKTNPPKEMLEVLAVLAKSLCMKENIPPKRVVPGRYFDKTIDDPGLLFNVKRFVKAYIMPEEKKDEGLEKVNSSDTDLSSITVSTVVEGE